MLRHLSKGIMKILFKYPTRGRVEKFFSTLDLYYKMIEGRDFEFLVTIDIDDKSMNTAPVMNRLAGYGNLKYQIVQHVSKIYAVNTGIEGQKFDILFIVSDDMIPQVYGFDNIIRSDFSKHFPDLTGCLWYNDGFQKDNVNTLQIMGRRWYERFGYVYYPGYKSLFSDVEYQDVAKRLGKIVYIDNVIVRHEHPNYGFGKYDSHYRMNNTNEAHDKKLYEDRKAIGFPVGIPKIAHFVWSSGVPLSYLRYLTYKTFIRHNPDWSIMFHIVDGCKLSKSWTGREKLEFESDVKHDDYIKSIDKAHILYHQSVGGIAPNYASDLVRWEVLYRYGGYYFDLDQLFIKPFDGLCDYDIVWGGSEINYSGVIGSFRRCPVMRTMYNNVMAKLNAGVTTYCGAGNWLWDHFVSDNPGMFGYLAYCTPMSYFYPVSRSENMIRYYKGERPDLSNSYAIHWFGGHPDSQAFNSLPNDKIDTTIKNWGIAL